MIQNQKKCMYTEACPTEATATVELKKNFQSVTHAPYTVRVCPTHLTELNNSTLKVWQPVSHP